MDIELVAAGVRVAEQAAASSGPRAGKTVPLTGTLRTLTREAAADLARSCGGRVSDTVSRKTSYVVVGTDPGAKLTRARTLGVPTLDEDAFLALARKPG